VLELIARGESLHQVLDTLLRVIQMQCPGMLASILLLDPDGSHVRHGGAPDLPEDYRHAIDGLAIGPQAGSCGTAAFTRKPVIVGDIATDPLWNDYRAMALKWGFRRRRTLIPGGTRRAFRAEGERFSERSDDGFSIVR
jgi:GAF domain-containing protein